MSPYRFTVFLERKILGRLYGEQVGGLRVYTKACFVLLLLAGPALELGPAVGVGVAATAGRAVANWWELPANRARGLMGPGRCRCTTSRPPSAGWSCKTP